MQKELLENDKVVVDIKYDADGWPLTFRPAGSPAGTWPHTPWWHSVLCDPYERINVWSHALPAILFWVLGITKLVTDFATWKSVCVFCTSAGMMHVGSAMTHVYPDDVYLEKLDHLGIATLVMGTPISTIMARFPDESITSLAAVASTMFLAAFFPPFLRTAAFGAGTLHIYALNFSRVHSPHLTTEVILYAIGAIAFLRGKGHNRPAGLQDHHFLHYCGTAACLLHLAHLYQVLDAA